MKKYGNIISKLRKEHGLTQQQLGKQLNVSYQAVSKWENNLSEPDLETIEKLTELFGISMAEFFDMAKDSNSLVKNSTHENNNNFIKNKPWYLVAGLGLVIVILSLCAFLIPVNFSSQQIFNKYESSIFYISAKKNNGDSVSATGFFIDDGGLAVTIFSNIKDCIDATAELSNGKQYKIEKLVGVHDEEDIALIKIDIKNSKPLKLADSNNVKMGDKVCSITYLNNDKLGDSESTIAEGIIFKVESSQSGTVSIQTTATISNANRGGALFNSQGKVIGIILSRLNLSGVGFDMVNVCIPINEIKNIKKDINIPIELHTAMNNKHTLTFISQDRVYSSETVDYDELVEEKEISREGYEFEGWYEDQEFTKLYDFSQGMTKSLRVYAKWKPHKYTVKFQSHDSMGEMQPLECEYDKSYRLPKNLLTKQYYDFSYWSYNGRIFEDESEILNLTSNRNGEVILEANYTPTLYTIEYISANENAQITFNQNLTKTYTIESQDIPLPTPNSIQHYTFAGWTLDYETQPSLNVVINSGSHGDRVYIANWVKDKYDITYNLDGGQFEGEVKNWYTWEDGIESFPIPIREYYTFRGWYYAPTSMGWAKIDKINPFTKDEEIYLEAEWEETQYQINFKDRNNNILNTKIVKLSTIDNNIYTPKMSGYFYYDYNLYTDKECTQLYLECSDVKTPFKLEELNHYNFYINAIKGSEGFVYNESDSEYVVAMISGYNGDNKELFIPNFIDNRTVGLTEEAFMGNSQFTAVYIPGNCRFDMSYRAFKDCLNIKTVHLAEGITYVTNQMFEGCISLVNLSLPSTIEEINYNAFKDCTSLEEMSLPESLIELHRSAFENTAFYNNEENWIENILYHDNCLMAIRSENIPSKVIVQEGTRLISMFAFYHSNVEEVILPETVKIIGYASFQYCRQLKTINLENVERIGTFGLANCDKLEILDLREATYIGMFSFNNCDAVKVAYLSKNLTRLEETIFSSSSATFTIYFQDSKEEFDSLNLEIGQLLNIYYYSNNFIEGQNSWVSADGEIAHWVSAEIIEINGLEYVYSENKPQLEGRYWYYDNDKIKLWI